MAHNSDHNPTNRAIRVELFTGTASDVRHFAGIEADVTFCDTSRSDTRNFMKHERQSTCLACTLASRADHERVSAELFARISR